jgi:outer membrane protein assembly factor BamB
VTGRLAVAPLIVDGRIRVYAAKRQLRADAPVDARTVYTPRWSFRRWPQQLAGVAAIGRTVISRWSDGALIALDGGTGKIVWRADGPAAPAYTGHRTGASTVWAPAGLHVAAGSVLVTGGGKLSAYDGRTGARRWQVDVPPACTDGFTTLGDRYVCPTGAFSAVDGGPVTSWPVGPYTPLGCTVAASGCAGLRDGAGQGWFVSSPSPRRASALDHPGSTLAAGYVFYPADGGLRSTDSVVRSGPRSPSPVVERTYPAGRILGTSRGNVLLLRPDHTILEFNPATGATRADFRLGVGTESTDWTLGQYAVTEGHLAIERLNPDGPTNPDAPDHYFTMDTVVVAAIP